MAEEIRSFQRLQHAFAASIRDPENEPGPQGVPAQRMQIYRQLVFNNLKSFLATGFPVVKATLGEKAWPALIKDFLRRHHSKTPYLFEISEEFLAYLQNERGQTDNDPPFLLELAHYEWVELALSDFRRRTPCGESVVIGRSAISDNLLIGACVAASLPVSRASDRPGLSTQLSAGGANFFARIPRSGRSGEVSGDRLWRLSPVGNAAKRRTSPSDRGASRDGNRRFR